MKTHLVFILHFLCFSLLSQGSGMNMNLVSRLDYQALHGSNLNDCWGYTDETGIEYALVGGTKGTSVVSLANPQSPQEILWVPGNEGVWRDLQVYQDVAYIVSEQEDGLLMIDLSALPQSTVLPTSYYFGPANNPWSSAHDLFIDTLGGWAYICGADRGNGGIIILDIHTNPLQPIEVGVFDNWYCHDAFAQGNKLYGAHIIDGILAIIDVSDHANPVLIGQTTTPNDFTHNVWVTSDDHFAVTTDEKQGAFVAMYDVSNPSNIQFLDKIQSSPGEGIVPHNSFILHDSLIVTSYYKDGVVIHDMSRPDNLVEIASYDTYDDQNGVFIGSWGVYPFFASGLILASDMTQGLFVLNATFPKPSYYEGVVRDANTLALLNNVKVEISGNPQNDFTDNNGRFGVGTIATGAQSVNFFKLGYAPQDITVNFSSNQVIFDTIDLVPIVPTNIQITVTDESTSQAIIGAKVKVQNTYQTQEFQTDGFGEIIVPVYYPGIQTITAGNWGNVTKCVDVNVSATGSYFIALEKGYYDDFAFDFSWSSTTDSAYTGLWERTDLRQTSSYASPADDAQFDCGNLSFATGGDDVFDPNEDDVDGGKVTLKSPIFDATGISDPFVYFESYMYCNYGPNAGDDTLFVYLSNGTDEAKIFQYGPQSNLPTWQKTSIRIEEYMAPSSQMQLTVEILDLHPNHNVTEAGFDLFRLTSGSILAEAENAKELKMYPNPSNGKLFLADYLNLESLMVFNLLGEQQKVESQLNNVGEWELNLSHLPSGVYFIQIDGVSKKFVLSHY